MRCTGACFCSFPSGRSCWRASLVLRRIRLQGSRCLFNVLRRRNAPISSVTLLSRCAAPSPIRPHLQALMWLNTCSLQEAEDGSVFLMSQRELEPKPQIHAPADKHPPPSYRSPYESAETSKPAARTVNGNASKPRTSPLTGVTGSGSPGSVGGSPNGGSPNFSRPTSGSSSNRASPTLNTSAARPTQPITLAKVGPRPNGPPPI